MKAEEPEYIKVRLLGGPLDDRILVLHRGAANFLVPVLADYGVGLKEFLYRPTGKKSADGLEVWEPEERDMDKVREAG